MSRRRLFTEEQEDQVCEEYFSEEKPSIKTLAKRHGCSDMTIRNVIVRHGYTLRTCTELLKGIFVKGEKHPLYGTHPIAWNRGLTKETDERLQKTSKSLEGHEVSEKTREKLKDSLNKFYICEEGLKRREEHRNYILQHFVNIHGPFKDTKPELKMKEILNELSIPFECQYRVGNHLADFYLLNTNTLIEVDGDWFHGNPKKYSKLNEMQQKQRQRDIKNDQIAKELGYTVLRFWENDILKNEEFVINKLKEKL